MGGQAEGFVISSTTAWRANDEALNGSHNQKSGARAGSRVFAVCRQTLIEIG
jgi:hypothetical protein